MQRVLSFQMARGFGESSEFVTKRMCFSFLFSVGFLCLLCGFLIGRFAAGRAIDIRAERAKLQLAGNGLEMYEHVRQSLVQEIRSSAFTAKAFVTNDRTNRENTEGIKNALLDLQFFDQVYESASCIVATVRGHHEPDRNIVVVGTGEGIAIVMELSKALESVSDDYDWKPRRTIIFMISLESSAACHDYLENSTPERIVSYIELNLPSIEDSGYFVTSGSDFVETNIIQASSEVKNPNYKNEFGEDPTLTKVCREIGCLPIIPRLRVDVPNAVVTFVGAQNSSSIVDNSTMIDSYRRAIGEIIGTSIWRLSEMTLFKWSPQDENEFIIKILEPLNSTEAAIQEIEKFNTNIATFNGNVEYMDATKKLDNRMANDLSTSVWRILLCSDKNLQSRTDWLSLLQISSSTTNDLDNYIRDLTRCYKKANELLRQSLSL